MFRRSNQPTLFNNNGSQSSSNVESRGPPIWRILFISYITMIVIYVWRATEPELSVLEIDPSDYLRQNPAKIIHPIKYNDEKQAWVDDIRSEISQTGLGKIKVVTWNIWFGSRNDPQDNKRIRFQAVIDILKKQDPDVISFQEVTKSVQQMILDDKWIQNNYWISEELGKQHRGYTITTLVKLPIKQVVLQDLPSQLGRKALRTIVSDGKDIFCLVNSHLESYKADADTRAAQLRIMNTFTSEKTCPNSILMGDFNFASDRERKDSVLPSQTDAWAAVSDEKGYTYDPELNKMIKVTPPSLVSLERGRIDVMFLHSKDNLWKPVSASLLGTESINGQDDLFPSDHFGLFIEFEKNSL